jgi:enamidase
MKVAIFNIAKILSGDIASPVVSGDTIAMVDGKITSVGAGGDVSDCDVSIDAAGMMVMPSLIDSHVHITFGDYTPRQKTVGFLESYIHGGVTTCISASEVHVPGRPRDPAGVKALAIAARKSSTPTVPAACGSTPAPSSSTSVQPKPPCLPKAWSPSSVRRRRGRA